MRNALNEVGKAGLLLLIGVLLLGAVAGGVYYFTVGTSETLVEDQDASSPGVGEGSDALPSPVETFGWGEVILEVEREPDGINVYFVNEGRVGFADLVLRCVTKYRKDFDSVACYGFPSLEALETAEVDPKTGGMEKRCWQAYYSVSGRGKDEKDSAGAIDNGRAGDLGCATT